MIDHLHFYSATLLIVLEVIREGHKLLPLELHRHHHHGQDWVGVGVVTLLVYTGHCTCKQYTTCSHWSCFSCWRLTTSCTPPPLHPPPLLLLPPPPSDYTTAIHQESSNGQYECLLLISRTRKCDMPQTDCQILVTSPVLSSAWLPLSTVPWKEFQSICQFVKGKKPSRCKVIQFSRSQKINRFI